MGNCKNVYEDCIQQISRTCSQLVSLDISNIKDISVRALKEIIAFYGINRFGSGFDREKYRLKVSKFDGAQVEFLQSGTHQRTYFS